MIKLLTKPLKAFSVYSLLLLIVSIPVYFFMVDQIWISELDERNEDFKLQIVEKLNELASQNDFENAVEIWNTLQNNSTISFCTSSEMRSDSVFESQIKELDIADGEYELERYRNLTSYALVNQKPIKITVRTNIEEVDETLAAIALVTLFFFLFLLAGFILLNRRISKSSWKSFYETLSELKSFELSKNKSLELKDSEIQEFQEMNEAISKLVNRNIDAYNQQKSFIENASHELQTPLAILRSKLDLFLQDKELTKQQIDLLATVEPVLARLTRINKNLLVLAKIENRQFADLTDIWVSEAVSEAVELFEDYLSAKAQKLETIFEDTVPKKSNPFLLETVIHNLLSNAIRYTPQGGQIGIEVSNQSLTILNTGSKPLDKASIFERFQSDSRTGGNNGLGLAIVREIANRYQWGIFYKFKDNKHIFTLIF